VSDEPQDEQLGFDIEVDEESTAEHAHAPATEEPAAVVADASVDAEVDEPDGGDEDGEGGDGDASGDDDDDDGGSRIARLDWDGDSVDASDALLDRAYAYGMYVNLGRALPDVRDGLKPVQRRIVHAMDELGGRAGRPYQKSALTVGHVIGNYHPHGDSAVYDAMVRMAQGFVLNVPLVDGQGNWGSVGPKEYSDPPAAYRYTEARLSPAATAWLADLRPEIVPEYKPNFTEKKQEPWVLPVTFPNLLVNGSRGIGWSMACEIPPHNLAEACAAAIMLAENPDTTLDDILTVMPGPDFPTGGILVDPSALPQAYAKGQGTVRLQARFHTEPLPGGVQAIVVTELPYGVSPDQIVAEVVKAARAEKIRDVTEMPRNLTDRHGTRVQIRCKRGGSLDRLISDLFRTTSLRVTVGINMTVLVEGTPRQIGLREALDRFVDFRFTIVTRRLEFERDELLRELHRLIALLAALDAIDAVIKIVRGSDDDEDAKRKLIAKLTVVPHGSDVAVPIDDEQAQWIIDMPIKRLARLNRLKLEEERTQKGDRVDEIGRILDSHAALKKIVVGELKAAMALSGPRRTVLGGEASGVNIESGSGKSATSVDVVARPKTEVWLGASRNGLFAALSRASMPTAFPIDIQPGDRPLPILHTDSESEILCFTADGQIARLRINELPLSSRTVRGAKALQLARNQELVALARADAEFVLLVTEGGEIKRCTPDSLSGSHGTPTPACGLPDGDRLVAAVAHVEGAEILIATAGGKVLRTAMKPIRPVKSASAGGVLGMKLAPGDRVIGACAVTPGDLYVAHESGFGKRVGIDDIPSKGRGGGGVALAAPDKPSKEPAGLVSAIACAETAPVATLLSGQILPVPETEAVNRAAVSRPLVDTMVGDEVVALS
jgi:DNA gyrase subunit A